MFKNTPKIKFCTMCGSYNEKTGMCLSNNRPVREIPDCCKRHIIEELTAHPRAAGKKGGTFYGT
ncbi:MAG TPA: hypothetical protein O0X70_02005 [Methanocorpusculum sp.]|nr:hypothetical protein [Methanocorpusculum sp.]